MRTLLIAVLGMFGVACVKTGQGGAALFEHPQFPYVVPMVGTDRTHPLGEQWRIDNYRVHDGELREPKDGPDYVVEREYDLDGDGQYETKQREPVYDLLLEHERIDANLWISTQPLPDSDAKKELRVFAERYIHSASGSSAVFVRFGAEGPVGMVQKQRAARMLTSESCSVSGHEAYRVDFEVANVDSAHVSSDTRWARGRLVLVRTPYRKEVAGSSLDGDDSQDYAVLMAVGAVAGANDFDSITPAFDQLLDRVVVRSSSKAPVTMTASTCHVAAAAAPATPAPAAASAGGEVPAAQDVAAQTPTSAETPAPAALPPAN